MANPLMAHVPRLIEGILNRARNFGSEAIGNTSYTMTPQGTYREGLVDPRGENPYRGGSFLAPTPPANVQPTPMPTQAPVQQASAPAPTQAPVQQTGSVFSGFNRPAPEPTIGELITTAAQANNIDPNVLAAVLFQESTFDPTVSAGPADSLDRGIAQINARWHPEITDQQAYDPAFAIPWAAQYLRGNIDHFGGDINRGVAAYNVGRGGAAVEGPATFGGGPTGQFYLDNVYRNLTDELIAELGLMPSPGFR